MNTGCHASKSVCNGLCSQKEGISPYMLKGIVGRGHAEFSTQRQQDAYEYLLHLFDFIDKIEMKNKSDFNPTALFKFQVRHPQLPALTGFM